MSSAKGAQGPPSAAKLQAIALNITIGHLICLLQLIFVAIFFISISPLIAKHISNGRLTQGWRLSRNSKEPEKGRNRNSIMNFVAGPQVVMNPDARAAAGWMAGFRNIYNKTLLRTIPVVDLTAGQLIVLALYSALLIVTSLYKVGSWDINPTRFGFIGIAQVPITFILAMKNTPAAIVGKGYEKLNFLHRFAGRMFLLFGVIHGAYYYDKQLTAAGKVTLTGKTLTGTTTIIAISVMFLTGLKPFRARLYQIFLTFHILGYLTVIVALWMHDIECQPYLIVAIAALATDAIFKAYNTHFRSASFTSLPGGLTKIEVDRIGDGWRAGQHVWIRVFNGRKVFEKHPFTIACAPNCDSPYSATRSLTLVAKATGGFTKRIHRIGAEDAVKQSYDDEKMALDSDTRLAVMVEGPYGGMCYTDFRDHESAILVAGGSGFSFVMAVLEDIVGSRLKGKAVTQHILVIWSLREVGMIAAYAEPIRETLRLAKSIDLDIAFRCHVTRSIPFQTISPVPELRIIQSRPNMSVALSETVDLTIADVTARGAARGAGVGLGVCGPIPLVKSCRQAAATIDAGRSNKAGGVTVHSEMFGW